MANSYSTPQQLHLNPDDRHLVNVNKAKLINPNVEIPEGLVDEARRRFFANFVESHKSELEYRSLSDLEHFIDSLPQVIHGSGKEYRRSEIGKLTAEVLTGGKTSDFITSKKGIRREVEAYMRGRIIQASEQIPGFISKETNPYTGRPIRTYQDRFLYADQALRFAQLKPETAQAFNRGYQNMDFSERSKLLHEIAGIHGKFMEFKGQDHLYLADRDIEEGRKKRNKLPDIKQSFEWVQEHREDYERALREGRRHQAQLIRQSVGQFVDHALPTLGTEFKVHVHPHFNLVPATFDRLLLALRLDPHFRLNIDAFKVGRSSNDEYDDPQAGIVPSIVIYPHRGADIRHSREILERIVDRTSAHLKDLDHPSSSAHEIPRFNHQLSDIIFMAQCGGDMKSDLAAMGLLDDFFDPDYNYGVLRPKRNS